MFNGNSRWYGLTLLAIGNLVLWVAIAALVGLLVGDEVDLGLETELRQVQATAQAGWDAAWNRLSAGEPVLPTRSTSAAGLSRPTATPPALRQPWPTAGIAWSEPGATPAVDPAAGEGATAAPPAPSAVARDPGGAEPRPATASPISLEAGASWPRATATPTLGAGPARTATADKQPAATSGQVSAAGALGPTPAPTQALLSQPLLLADPEFHNLAGLNAEMARSVPGRVVQIRYQEATLNRELNLLCENNPDLPFRTVQADLKRDQIVLRGEITVLGFQVDARVTGTIVARDCLPQIEIQSVAVAGVLTPQLVRDQIEREVLDAMAWYPADYPLCLEQIVLEETRATIYGYRR